MAYVLVTASVLHVAPATAAEVSAGSMHRVALFPVIVRGRVPPRIIEIFQKSLVDGSGAVPGLEVMSGRDLRRRLGRQPRAALKRCERAPEFGTCLAGYVRILKVDEVLVLRAKGTPQGVTLLVVAVNRAGDPAVRIQARVRSVAELRAIVTEEKLPDVFGIRPEEPESKPEPEPPPPPAEEPAPASPPPLNVPAPAVGTRAEEIDNSATGASTPLAATSPIGEAIAFQPPPAAREGLSWVGLIGISAVVAGAAGAGTGVYLGLEVKRLRKELDRANGTYLQREAIRKYDQANQRATFANVLFVVGAILVAAGGGSLIYDLGSE